VEVDRRGEGVDEEHHHKQWIFTQEKNEIEGGKRLKSQSNNEGGNMVTGSVGIAASGRIIYDAVGSLFSGALSRGIVTIISTNTMPTAAAGKS
jgi:hypothetical protein